MSSSVRQFGTGATRDIDTDKLDFEAFLSPLVLRAYAEYLHKHRMQSDGKLRAGDNWQKGIPKSVYMKSAWRHFFDWWDGHRTGTVNKEAILALMFNSMGYLFEILRENHGSKPQEHPDR